MDKNDELLLEKNGWTIECESPFEIRNDETGDFASGIAANAVVDSLKPKKRKLHGTTLNLHDVNLALQGNERKRKENYLLD